METPTVETRPMTEEADFLELKSIDHVHLWVGNAKQSMYYWWKGFGFDPVAYSGLETGNRAFASYVLESGQIRLVVSAPYPASSEMSAHHMFHGDGVKVIAFGVDDVNKAFGETVKRGAQPAWAPKEDIDEYGALRTAAIHAYGEVLHVFVDRKAYGGAFAPKYRKLDLQAESAGLASIDHIVGNVQLGKMDYWVNYYHQVMGFRQLQHFDDKAISTEYSALMSKVMQNGNGRIKLPINEPAEGRKKSQIEEFLDYYNSPGVQHLALSSGNIIESVRTLRERGIEFLRVPNSYYEVLPDRVGEIKESLDEIRDLGILVDRDDEGYLLQIFSRPIQDRPTMFIEVIQRHGSRGFGKGNFKALFEALEIEQANRGNL
ncbi:MAG: 4-hydroxyphenylpyruvate dioxygenase [Chloroflexi bacterium]|nr:MAG: 4-hydroxyphenylpyruvate dioxygenase [Chloroflexota bacterium]